MIKVDGLSKHFGAVKAVNGVSFTVAEGETLVLLGTSGCGKTTTLKMLNRLIEPTSGTIKIGDKDVAAVRPEVLRRGIGYVLQHNGLFPHYTVAENIAIVPNLLKWDNKRINDRTTELLHKLHLDEAVLKKYPGELSGGQQQRVGLARALIADAPVLLMDEPFGALDNVTRASIQQEFRQLDEFKKKTIVMVTHDVQEAFLLGDNIAIMHQGRLMQIGSPAGLLFNPADSFVKDFLKEQRLLLELRSVKLVDIWPQLTVDTTNTADNMVDAEESVWAAMELLKQSAGNTITITHAGEHKTINSAGLMTAFYQYKPRPAYE